VAGLMRPLIREMLVNPCVAQFPWMGSAFRVE